MAFTADIGWRWGDIAESTIIALVVAGCVWRAADCPPTGCTRAGPALEPLDSRMSWTIALSMAVSLALLTGCSLLAWKRRRTAGDRPGRAVRNLLSAILPALGLALIVLMVSLEQEAEPVLFIPFTLALAYVMSLPVVLVIELVTWRLRPVRTGRWLAAAMALFAVSFVLVPVLISVLAGAGSMDQAGASAPRTGEDAAIWIALDYLMAVQAAALVWWSYLPPARVSVASLFE